MLGRAMTYRTLAAAATVSVFLTATLRPAHAEDDKNGVSPTTISRPSGPGSLEGLGDAFQPALNTGMARYSVKFQLPDGVAGFTPTLALQYDSGLGFGPAGIGWTFSPGSIRRQTEKGMPRYTDEPDPPFGPDRFLGMNGEELVPLANGYFLAKIEGSFVRCRRVGNAWEAHTKSGTKLEFGLTSTGRISDSTGSRIFEWCLERQTDTNGNVIRYVYDRPVEADRQVYLSEVRYGPGAEPWDHQYSVHLTYEDRLDTRTDYRSGFLVRTAKRLKYVDIYYDQGLVRRYELRYEADPHCSLLTSVIQYGDDGVSTLPVTTFEYATFSLPDPATPISAFGHVIGSTGEPSAVVDNAKVDLLDVNADGLPDLLTTDTGHFAYLNRGVGSDSFEDPAVQWEGPVAIDAIEQRVFSRELSEDNVHLADMNGDGLADFVVTDGELVEYFPNSGDQSWAASTFMSVDFTPPPAPFGTDGPSVLTTDLDFDKRIDIIKSDFGAYSVWFNLGGGSYSAETLVDGAYYNSQFVDFADPGVELSDVNGDRLNDIVKITPISVVYFPAMGYGQFDDPIEMLLPDRFLDESPSGNLHRAKMTDINGDGLADLVVERAEGSNLWFWLNMGDGTFAISRVVTDMPTSLDAAVRWADINGNGTTDLIYADSTLQESRIRAVDLAVLITGSSHFNALLSIDNGYGRRTAIEYRSSTDFYLDALAAGNSWTTTVPFPVELVSRTRTSTGLDLDGHPDDGPNGDEYITDYSYRDGYYDPLEKQFRGFAFVKQIDHGDERFGGSDAPTLVTRHGFHTGAPDGVDNDGDGDIDEFDYWDGREEEPLKGVELWRESTALPDDPMNDGGFAPDAVVFDRTEATWEVRTLCTDSAGLLVDELSANYATNDHYARVVRYAVSTKELRTIIERQTDPALHKHIETRTDFDPFGNKTVEWERGHLSNSADDLYTEFAYVRGEAPWIVGLVSRTTQRAGSASGPFVSETRHYYDGDPYVGLPLGQVGTKGNLHRTEEVVSADPVPALTERSFARGDPRDPSGRIDSLRQKLDAYGNPIVVLDANAALGPDGEPNGAGHERRIHYDSIFHKFPVRETIVIGSGSPDLVVDAEHHFGFGTPTSVTDFNGNITRYVYDTFGRLHREIHPGDDPSVPTRTYEYDLGAPVSSITTIAHAAEGGSPDIETAQYFDGLGRMLGSFEAGGPAMEGVTRYNQRGTAWKIYQPYAGMPFDSEGEWNLPTVAAPATLKAYDATGRVVETTTPEDADGTPATMRKEYLPLTTVAYDGEDTNAMGPHFGTPKTSMFDGLNRLVEVHEIETLSAADSGTFITRYRYALPDLLAEVEDAKGNIKYMRYDGLGRKIFMNDCDRGHMTYTYDAVGNVMSTMDARGQEIQYTYDGANRVLTEDYLDDGMPLSLTRAPDVVYHYDKPSPEYPLLANTQGRLAFVEDLTGIEFRGYNTRGAVEQVVKRVDRENGAQEDWMTDSLVDSLDRPYQIIYPDGNVVRQEYDARGLLTSIPGFMSEMLYRPSRQKGTCTFANGVVTNYEYDPRLRLTRILTESDGQILQDLNYQFDQADNVLNITDGRPLPPADPRNQTASFIMDNCYRLARAVGAGYGTIAYDYDRLGNMVSKTSPDINDPTVDLGQMTSGGLMGTSNRIGRAPTDAPGPHALTEITKGQSSASLTYDANGNLTGYDSDSYLFDFDDRLGRVVKDGHDIRYLYDWTDRRVIKRVDGNQTTYISRLSEVRDGELLNYVFAGDTRVARVDGSFPPPPELAQRLHLSAGWNLVSLQVDVGTTDPAVLLQDLDGKYDAVFGHDGNAYTRYVPGASDNTLTALHPHLGYWLLMAEPGDLLLEGVSVADSAAMSGATHALIGLPGMQSLTPAEFAAHRPEIRAIHAYVGNEGRWRTWHRDAPGFLNTLTTLTPGRGYWVEAIAPAAASVGSGPPNLSTFYHPDHLGSTNLITGDVGSLFLENVYYPFGARRSLLSSASGKTDPFYGFSDKEKDAESSLMYFEARYCTGPLARFTSVDPTISVAPKRHASTPQWLNLYAYAANNPMRYVDPTGHEPKEKVSFVSQAWDMFAGGVEFAKEIAKTSPKPTQASPLLVPIAPKLGPVAKVAGKVTETLKPAAPFLKVVGTGLGLVSAGMATATTTQGVMDKDAEKIVGGSADLIAAGVGLLGGSVGAAGAGGYAGGSLAAEQIDKHTDHYKRSTAAGHAAEAAATKATGNETLGTVVGAASAGLESILPGSTAGTTGFLEWISE